MDFISHILIGRALAVSPKNSRNDIYLIIFFSLLPDLPLIIVYPYLGFIKARLFLMPLNIDWEGFRAFYPFWSATWEIAHSIIFAFLIILPIVLILKLSKILFVAYLSHIFVDLFTHAGEWAIKPFYPLQYKFQGFTNAWVWPLSSMIISWLVILLVIILLNFIFQRNKRQNLS